MGYQEELNRLQKIITSDDSTEAQRRTARKAKKALIDGAIGDAFIRFEDRAAEYENLVDRLKSIVDRISVNQLTSVMEDLNTLIKETQPPDDDD